MLTKEQLMSAVESLLREKALDEITVSEIVTEKKLCQETFYQNFTDKYDLADLRTPPAKITSTGEIEQRFR